MDASEQHVTKFLGQPIRYKIPIYQRRYSWTQPQWRRLLYDILALKTKGKHFFGSIVLSNSRDEDFHLSSQYIIDGQQRIVTISILLKAICDLASQSDDPQEASVAVQIMDGLLTHQHDATDNRFRVQPNRDDFNEYKALFSDQPVKSDSRIACCYRFFYSELQLRVISKEITLHDFVRELCGLFFIKLELASDDDAQVIFESINATGLALTESDKIRNFILMRVPTAEQEQYYLNYWEKIECNTGDDINNFIRYYLLSKSHARARLKALYADFKHFWAKVGDEKEALAEMVRYSQIYKRITVPGAVAYDPRGELSKILFRLTSAELLRPASPFLLAAVDYCKRNNRDQDIVQIFRILESYMVRRIVCQYDKNANNAIFCSLHADVMREVNKGESYPKALNIVLLSKQRTQEYPDAERFKNDFINLQFYAALPKASQLYLLARLESGDAREGESHKEVLEKLVSCEYTIEHIMPRKLTAGWRQALGSNAEEIHQKYLHTLGNITITAYNPLYSNRTFAVKKKMHNGFNDSPLRLNASLKKVSVWNEQAIIDRANLLFCKALTLWPKEEKESRRVSTYERSLNTQDIFTFTELCAYEYKGVRYPGEKWAAAIVKLLDTLKKANPNNANLNNVDPSWWSNQIVNTHTNAKINALRRLFVEYDLDQSELTFYLKPISEDASDANVLDYSAEHEDNDSQDEYIEEAAASYSVPLDSVNP